MIRKCICILIYDYLFIMKHFHLLVFNLHTNLWNDLPLVSSHHTLLATDYRRDHQERQETKDMRAAEVSRAKRASWAKGGHEACRATWGYRACPEDRDHGWEDESVDRPVKAFSWIWAAETIANSKLFPGENKIEDILLLLLIIVYNNTNIIIVIIIITVLIM